MSMELIVFDFQYSRIAHSCIPYSVIYIFYLLLKTHPTNHKLLENNNDFYIVAIHDIRTAENKKMKIIFVKINMANRREEMFLLFFFRFQLRQHILQDLYSEYKNAFIIYMDISEISEYPFNLYMHIARCPLFNEC